MKKFDTNKTFKKALLGGMSVVAFTAMVGVTSVAFAADEIYVDENDGDDGVYETDVDTAVDLGTYTGHDIQYRGNAATINFQNGETIGGSGTTTGAITASTSGNDATGDTLTIINDQAGTDATLTITGNIDDGDTDDFNLIFDVAAEGDDTTETSTVDVNGTINLGAGDLTIKSDNTNAGGNVNTNTVLVSGDITANGGITLNVDTTNTEAFSDVTLVLDGTAATQTVTGAIDAADAGDGRIIVRNSFGTGVTFASAVGGTTDVGSVIIGDATAAGDAVFSSTLDAETLTVDGQSGASTATFTGAVTMTAAGDGSGNVDINGGDAASETASADFNGNFTAAGDVDIVGGSNASADASASFAGATVTATGSFDLDDGTASATMTLDGAVAQTVTGDIDGVGGAEGTLIINNTHSSGATFESEIGASQDIAAIKIGTVDGSASTALFTDDSGATAWTLGNGGSTADTITANFDADDGALTVAGTIDGSSTDTTILQFYDVGADAAANTVTVSGIVGGTTGVTTINVGSSTQAGDASFSAAVTATTINVTGGDHADEDANVEFVDDVTANIVLDDNLGTATALFDQAGAETITGTITAAGDGEGVITVENSTSTTFTGQIGSSSAKIGTINIGTANDEGIAVFNSDVYATNITFDDASAANTATFKGNVTATAITLDDTGNGSTLNLSGTSAQTIAGTIDGTAAGDGVVDVVNTSGTVTFSGKLGNTQQLKEIEVSSSATAVFSDTVDTALLDLDGTATFEVNNNIVDGGTLNFADGSKIILGSGVVSGETVFEGATGGVTITTTGTDSQITVEMPSNFSSGEIRLIHDNGAHGIDANDFVLTDTALVDYAFDTDGHASFDNDGNEVVVTATAKSLSTTASELGITSQEASALSNANTAVGTGDATALSAMTTALNAGGSEATKAAEQVSIQADTLGAASSAAIGTGTQVVGVASNRLASLRSGAQYAGAEQTGFASGDAGMAKAVWVKPFGNWISQDDKGGVSGYDADTYGIAGGLDAEIADGVRLGGSLAYSNTDVDGKGSGNSQTDIDSYQVTVYGDYTTDKYYVEGMVGYARNNNDTSRELTFGGLNRTASGDYDSNQYMASVGAGMPINLKGNAFVTPMAGLAYTHVSSDSYTETGAGNLNLTVNPDDVDAFIASLGAKFHTKIKQGKGHLIPSAKLGVSYDFSGDEAAATGTYTGGGSAFTVEGAEVEQLAGNAGLGLTYDDGAWSVGANYDAEVKSDYVGHSATLEARFKF